MFILKNLDAAQSALSGILCGVSAFTFRYLGKLQECNDILVSVELFVHLGDKNALINALPLLSCLGKFKQVLEHVKQLI